MKESRVEEPSKAATIIGCNEDLLSIILIHLPARTLMKFKLVSIQWQSLICDRKFSIEHSRKTFEDSDSKAPCGLFLYYHFYQSSTTETVSVPLFGNSLDSVPPLSFLNEFSQSFGSSGGYIRSCNGLLLCSFYKRNLVSNMHRNLRCVVCDPTTRDYKVLPMPELENDEWLDGLTLVFNPSKSFHFKVVGFKRSFYGRDFKLYIYYSEMNNWKFCHLIDLHENYPTYRGVFLNDTVYWIGLRLMHYYNINSKDVGHLNIPEIVHGRDKYFAESSGHFYLATSVSHYNANYGEINMIYEFENNNMQWLKSYVEVLEDAHFGRKNINRSLFAVVKGKNDSECVILHTTSRRLLIFDLVLHKKVEALELPRVCHYKACEYIPSLAPV